MSNGNPANGIAAHLHAERDALKSFIALLETEQQDLGNSRTDQLQELAEKKTRAAQELSRLESVRKEKLRAHGIGDAQEDWLRNQAPVDLRQSWQDILLLAAQARNLNHTNGALIQTQLRYNQQALAALYKAANSVEGLYGPDGQTRISPAGRTLGSV